MNAQSNPERENESASGEKASASRNILPPAQFENSEAWVQAYREQFGVEPSFF